MAKGKHSMDRSEMKEYERRKKREIQAQKASFDERLNKKYGLSRENANKSYELNYDDNINVTSDLNNQYNIEESRNNYEDRRKKHKEAKKMREKKKTSGVKKFFKVLGIILLILILLACGVGVGAYIYLKNSLDTMQHVDVDENSIEVNDGVEESLKGYRTIALYGVDSREDQLESGTRSDCIILAIIDQANKKVKLVSVYRDTYVRINEKGNTKLDKLTHAYAYGGAALSMSTINTNMDLDVKEFATVNFNSLVDIVNAVDGVDITIESDEIKYINDYIDANNQILKTSSSHITKTGTQNLDGVQALAYARIRYTAGGDYKRTERMRTVLTAIANKAKKMSVSELNGLAKTILPKVYTNISSNEIISLLPTLATYSITESIGWPYETKGITLDRWYGVPVTLESNVKKLHQEVYGDKDYSVSSKVREISNAIITKTGYR